MYVPILCDVATRLGGGTTGLREDPQVWAYAVRDAVELVQPGWIVTHHDPTLEADAVLASGIDLRDVVDLELARQPPVDAAVTVTGILARLYPSRPVVASLTGPAALARRLGVSLDEAEGTDVLLDLGDALADLVAAYVAAGASRFLVWEDAAGTAAGTVGDAHVPVLRRMALLGASAVLCGAEEPAVAGYAADAWPGGGRGATLVPCTALPGPPQGTVPGTEAAAAHPRISDGPVAADVDLAALRAAASTG